MKVRAFHVCVSFDYRASGTRHVFSGVLTTDEDPFDPNFHARLMQRLGESMSPPRDPKTLTLESLSLLAEKTP